MMMEWKQQDVMEEERCWVEVMELHSGAAKERHWKVLMVRWSQMRFWS
jgi:hypothetical protein